jgi:hypothetical protein
VLGWEDCIACHVIWDWVCTGRMGVRSAPMSYENVCVYVIKCLFMFYLPVFISGFLCLFVLFSQRMK